MNDFFGPIMAAILGLFGGSAGEPPGYAGYVEADYVYVMPLSPGRIVDIAVAEGDMVAQGAPLFALDPAQQRALLDAANARMEAAKATLLNLETGSRVEEIEVIRANLSKAQADLALAQSNLARSRKLHEAGTVPAARVEQDEAALAAAQAQVNQLSAQVAVAELPARDAQQLAAEANLAAAEAEASRAALDLAERTAEAPVDGTIERLFFSTGEVAGTTMPVLSILPQQALEARFFVPEAARSSLQPGQTVTVTCDGCGTLTASIIQIASQPQTTPPIIYSREERERLVYLVRARLEDAARLQPGQPVTVVP